MKITKSELSGYIKEILKEVATGSTNSGGIMNALSRSTEPMEEISELVQKMITSLEDSTLSKNIERMNIDMKDVSAKLNQAKSYFSAGAGMVSYERVSKQIQDENKLAQLKDFLTKKFMPKLIENTNNIISVANTLKSQVDKKLISKTLEAIKSIDKDMSIVKYLIENPENSGDLRQFDGGKINVGTLFKTAESMAGGNTVNEAKVRNIIRQELKKAGY